MKSYKKISINLIILIGIILLIAMSFNATFAATKNIDNTTSGGINGAITNSSTQPGDTILLESGNYTGTNNTGITINKNITIQGNGPTDTVIIDAQGLSRIFAIGNNVNITFINITFINGYTTSYGGAIYNTAGAMTITNCTFSNNTVNSYGGAIYNTAGAMTVVNCTFSNNIGITGSAIHSSGTSAVNMSITNCTFINNTASGFSGTVRSDGANTTITNCIFSNNTASSRGGAIYNTAGAMTVVNCTFSNNTSSRGGAIYNTAGANTTITNSTFNNNAAYGPTYAGGAIHNLGGANMTITNCTFSNNTANSVGGAIHNLGGANMTITNCTFSNNTANSRGGVIYNTAGANTTITNCTFSNNTASSRGGAIYNTGGMFVVGNVMVGNNATVSGPMIFNAGNMGILNLTYLNNMTVFVDGSGVILFALLTDDMGNTVSGGTIYFYVNGTLVGSAVSDRNGMARISFTIPDSMRPAYGDPNNFVPVNGTYSGNTGYSIDIYNGELEIPYNGKIPTQTTINLPNDVIIGQTRNITGVATDRDGNPLANIQINVTINGQTFTVTTNSTGGWTLPYTFNQEGLYDVLVQWAGNSTHLRFDEIAILDLAKILVNTTINIPSNVKVGQNINITGIAKDEKGNPLANTQIQVIINGQTFTVTTNSTGGWILSYTFTQEGLTDITVQWAGNISHSDFSEFIEITVNRAVANSTINIPSDVRVGKTINITGILKDEFGNLLAGIDLVVTIGGQEYYVTTNSTGGWTVSYTPTATGNVAVIVSLTDHVNYMDFTNSTVFNPSITKEITNSTVVVSNGKVSRQSTISGVAIDENGNPIANTQITVTINGTSYNVTTDSTGAWSLNITPNTSGNLTVIVTWTGNSTHESFTNSTIFFVANLSTNSTITVVNSNVGKSTTINGTAIDENGNVLANVQLNITINGTSYTVTTDSTGFWSLTYIPNVAGNLLAVQVNWTGNATHNGFTNTTVLNVSKAATNSTINVGNGTVGKPTIINGTVTDENGNVLAGVTLNVTINSVLYTVTTNSAGFWNLTYIPNTSGTFSVQVSYLGNTTHLDFVNTTNFNVANANSNSTVVTPNGKVGKQSTINGVATDENGNVLANVQLSVTVNGTSYTVTTNSAGVWSLNVTPNTAGNLNVLVSWAGNSTHENFTNSTTFNVAKANTNSTINVPNTNAGQPMNITGVALDENGNPLANVNLTIVLDGTSYNVTTDNNGAWILTYTPMHEGLFDLSVNWTGNSTHLGFTNTTVFSVPKVPANTTINAPDSKVKKAINITGVATDDNNNPLANADLTITLDGQNYNVTTDNAGRWTLTYTPTHAGVLTVSVSYAGNNTHGNFTNTTSFNVEKLDTTSNINVPNDVKVGKTINITGVALDENGDPLTNTELTVTIDGKTYKVTTDSNGKWILPYKPTRTGNIVVSVSWAGNSTHNGFTNSIEFIVTKQNNQTNTTNKTSDNPAPAKAVAMKKTGLPIIAILFILLSTLGLGLIVRKKQN